MPVIPLATTKGGVGKTTTAINLAIESFRRGFRVAMIDADPKSDLVAWARLAVNTDWTKLKANLGENAPPTLAFEILPDEIEERTEAAWETLCRANFAVVREIEPSRMTKTISRLNAAFDVVFVDLQGSANQSMLMAFARADLVVIPVQTSRFDIKAAMETLVTVESAGEMIGRPILSRVLITRTKAAIRSRAARSTRNQMEKLGVPLLAVEFIDRTVFNDMTFSGAMPSIDDPASGGAVNVRALWLEVFGVIKAAADAATNVCA